MIYILLNHKTKRVNLSSS